MLKGNFPTLSTLTEYYAAYCSSVSLGQHAETFTVAALTADIGSFSSFVSFLVTFFSAPGLVATQLMTLVTLGTTLSLRLGPLHRARVLSINLTNALQTSLTNFASAQETWLKIPALGRPSELVAAQEKLVEAKDAVEMVQSLDLTPFGFNDAIVTSSPVSHQYLKRGQEALQNAEQTASKVSSKHGSGLTRDTFGCISGIDPPRDQGKKSYCYNFAFRGGPEGCPWPQCDFNHYTQLELAAIP